MSTGLSLFTRGYAALRRRCVGTVTEFRTEHPVVALTFDDGPDAADTPRVLSLLEAYGARATFFMVGEAASTQRVLLRRMHEAGHVLANHTWNHQSVAALPRAERRHQIRACARALAPYGHRLFRPPWGQQTVAARLDAFLLRHDVIGWSVDAGDWWNPDASAMSAHLLARIQPGAIVLLHDHIRSQPAAAGAAPVQFRREAMLVALSTVLEQAHGRVRFVTIPEMFRLGRPVRRDWFVSPAASPGRQPVRAA